MISKKSIIIFTIFIFAFNILIQQTSYSIAQDNTIYIYIADDLDKVRNNPDAHFIQKNDIDLSSYKKWIPINKFTGTFDGNGHKIRNLTITDAFDGNIGLFGTAESNATIENVVLENVSIKIDVKLDENTLQCFQIGALVGSNWGSIKNCSVSGNIFENFDKEEFKSSNVGGLIGYNYGYIKNCSNFADISGAGYVGGIVGNCCSDIENCFNTGSIKSGNCSVGGIIGYACAYEGSLIMLKCYNAGNVNGVGNLSAAGDINKNGTGGLVGFSYCNIKIQYCYNSGNIFGANNVGGIVGIHGNVDIDNSYNIGDISGNEYVGGITGCENLFDNNLSCISFCYNSGKVTGNNTFGALEGESSCISTERCYYKDSCSSDTTGSALTADEMKIRDNFKEWDFKNIWENQDGKTYPQLKALVPPSIDNFNSQFNLNADGSINSLFKVTFSKDVLKGNGSIFLVKPDNTTQQSIDVQSDSVIVQNNIASIFPKEDLNQNEKYSMLIDNDCFKDCLGNYVLDTKGNNKFDFIVPALTTTPQSITACIVPEEEPLSEKNLDKCSVKIELCNDSFIDENINKEDFVLNNAPTGMTVSNISNITTEGAVICFNFDGTDFDSNIDDFSISIDGKALKSGKRITSNAAKIEACNDPESISICGNIKEGSEDGSSIIVRLDGGTFASKLTMNDWNVSNLPQGVKAGSIKRIDEHTAKIILSGNSIVHYDKNITNVTISCSKDEYNDDTNGGTLSANTGVIFNSIPIIPNKTHSSSSHSSEFVPYKFVNIVLNKKEVDDIVDKCYKDMNSTHGIAKLPCIENNDGSLGIPLESIKNSDDKKIGFFTRINNIEFNIPDNLIGVEKYKSSSQKLQVILKKDLEYDLNALKPIIKPFNIDITINDIHGGKDNIYNFNDGKKIKVSVKLSQNDMKGINPALLSAYYFNKLTNKVEYIDGRFNMVSNEFVFYISHTGNYAVVERKNNENSWVEFNSKNQFNLKSKALSIKFNSDLEISEDNLQYIYVSQNSDGNSKMYDTNVKFDKYKKNVIIIEEPKGGYVKNKPYYIFISPKIKSICSKTLKNGIRFKFIVR